jgi:TPR repeat protein
MKLKCVTCVVLVLVTIALHLPGQQSEGDRKHFEDTKAKAEKGDVNAQCVLGEIYSFGHDGVTKDYSEAVRWFSKAAEQNNAEAQFNLGVCYAKGEGVAKDAVKAVKWYRKAAEQNVAEAQFNLGNCYFKGEGTAKDDMEAQKWWRKAAEQNDADAQLNLGVNYAKGEGVAKDEVESVKWYRKAAEQGNVKAQFALGNCFANGDGVKKDAVEAVKWYRKAADQGNAVAQFELGNSYYLGRGVLIDYVEAYKWNALAAAQGNEAAVNVGTYIYRKELRPDQISEGQRRAAAFKPSNAAQASPSVLGNRVDDSQPTASGTGFFISGDGFLITNAHVVEGATQIRLVTSAGFISAKVVKVDSANDLALLKAVGKFSLLPIVSSRSARLGNTVVTVGFPNIGLQGFAPKLAKGEIASLSGAGDDARYFQISVPVQPGNSGGALVDERGNVVGIVSAKLNASAASAASGVLPENVNYAVKSSFLLSFLESVPDVSAKLKEPNTGERKFEDVVKSAEQAAVLVLVY